MGFYGSNDPTNTEGLKEQQTHRQTERQTQRDSHRNIQTALCRSVRLWWPDIGGRHQHSRESIEPDAAGSSPAPNELSHTTPSVSCRHNLLTHLFIAS